MTSVDTDASAASNSLDDGAPRSPYYSLASLLAEVAPSALENDQYALENEQYALENEQDVLENEQDVLENEQDVLENEENVLENEQYVLENEQGALANEKYVLENEQDVLENEQDVHSFTEQEAAIYAWETVDSARTLASPTVVPSRAINSDIGNALAIVQRVHESGDSAAGQRGVEPAAGQARLEVDQAAEAGDQ